MFQIAVHPGKYTSDFMTYGDKGQGISAYINAFVSTLLQITCFL